MPYTRSHVISSLHCPFHGEAQSFSFLRISFTRHLFGMAGPTASGGGSSSQLCAKALVPQSKLSSQRRCPVALVWVWPHNKLAGFPTKMNYRYHRFAVARRSVGYLVYHYHPRSYTECNRRAKNYLFILATLQHGCRLYH